MKSHPRKHHRRTKSSVAGRSRSSSSPRRQQSSVRASSSFSSVALVPSRAPIVMRSDIETVGAECVGYLWALLGVCVLILMGGGQHVSVLGVALLLPGIALLLRPPQYSLGKWIDVGIVGVLGALLLAFVPQFGWRQPAWRASAVEDFGIDLPFVLSVQPWVSFEALLSVIAGFAWFYAASHWKINAGGRRKIYWVLSIGMVVFAAVVILGDLYGLRYPGAKGAVSFSFFPDRDQTANLMALGGVLTFGYAIEGLRRRELSHAVGLLSSIVLLAALVFGGSLLGVSLYFFGILLCFFFRLRSARLPMFVKVGASILLLCVGFWVTPNERTDVQIANSAEPQTWEETPRALMTRDTLAMIEDVPLTGVGLGNFPAVFSQYRALTPSTQGVAHPGSDWLWIGAEGGLVTVLFFTILVVSCFKACSTFRSERGGGYRMIALTAVIVFLISGLFGVSGHRPGTAYFAILCLAMALPRVSEERPSFRPVIWRLIGGILLVVGVLWVAASVFRFPTHSTVALDIQQRRVAEDRAERDWGRASLSVDGLIAKQPLAWSGYFQRAQIGLSHGDAHPEVALDFQRARFVEPRAAVVAYQEGLAWLPYSLSRTMTAWLEALDRDVNSNSDWLDAMLRKASVNGALLSGMIEMTQDRPNDRARLMLSLDARAFQREMTREQELDPSLGRFSRAFRTELVKRWIHWGRLEAVDHYLQQYGETLDDAWLLTALVFQGQSQYRNAVELMRAELVIPAVPQVPLDLGRVDHLKRGFFISANDVSKGTALLSHYLERGEFGEALRVVDVLIQQPKVPRYVLYWHAELLYQLGDYLESWYAFEAYWQQLD